MSGLKKPHSSNPFDSDDEFDQKSTLTPSRRTSSELFPLTPNSNTNPFDDDDKPTLTRSRRTSSEPFPLTPNSNTNPFDDDDKPTSYSSGCTQNHMLRNKYKNDFVDSGGIENQNVQELEKYAVFKAEETTKTVKNALKIAEGIREDATKTVITLHRQGEQITRTHMAAADIDQDLSRGEKLLGTLGGLFSRTWKPKKGRTITGPLSTGDGTAQRRGSHLEQREKLGLMTTPNRGQAQLRKSTLEPTDALQKVEYEKTKQDDALSDLSNLLGELKEMAIDMGSEIDRQNKALDPFHDDVDELNFRVKGANQRTRRLLGK